jgi:unsaturated rhamnogalacturonyl hydrolase
MLRRLTGALLATAFLLGPLQACAATPAKPGVSAAVRPNPAVLAAGAQVADWQLSHMDNFDYVPASQFYIGLTAYADASSQSKYDDAIVAHGQAEGWGFDKRPRHADADATGAIWIWAAAHTHDAAKLAPIRARFDAILATPSTVDLGFEAKPPEGGDPYCQARWCWSDAIFMAPPAWVALSKETRDPRYLAHADSEFWATTDLLYDKADHLYFRDSRFIAKRSDAGAKIFWGRGNGWAFASCRTCPRTTRAARAMKRCSGRWPPGSSRCRASKAIGRSRCWSRRRRLRPAARASSSTAWPGA